MLDLSSAPSSDLLEKGYAAVHGACMHVKVTCWGIASVYPLGSWRGKQEWDTVPQDWKHLVENRCPMLDVVGKYGRAYLEGLVLLLASPTVVTGSWRVVKVTSCGDCLEAL